ncbi:mevalonate kinase family protein [Streptomyces aureocirculatus]|uniref:mevalonate kinase family protein n=1 Tax=Streptomyces aureocirculatus TaxID=67275 RepID=UPI000A4ED27E|nr:galactokinase [Streptomyces aureocirculatus]
MIPTHPIRAVVPCRACLSGEDLDWLGGGRSVSVALSLTTTVEAMPTPAPDRQTVDDWSWEVWAFLRERLPGLGPRPPAVTVRSEAPEASGLSSSTARIVALLRAFTDPSFTGRSVGDDTITQWAYEFEFAVFNGGGMDHLAVVEGGALLLEGREHGLPAVRERLEFPDEWRVLVVDSGTRKDTRHHIRDVRAQLAAGDPALAAYRAVADEASGRVWEALHGRDLPGLGAAMVRAHEAMRDQQRMSTPFLEELRSLALRVVGLPLKLSGAGGGGALVGVCPADAVEETVARLTRALSVSHPQAKVLPTRAAPGARRGSVPAGQGGAEPVEGAADPLPSVSAAAIAPGGRRQRASP